MVSGWREPICSILQVNPNIWVTGCVIRLSLNLVCMFYQHIILWSPFADELRTLDTALYHHLSNLYMPEVSRTVRLLVGVLQPVSRCFCLWIFESRRRFLSRQPRTRLEILLCVQVDTYLLDRTANLSNPKTRSKRVQAHSSPGILFLVSSSCRPTSLYS